MPAFFLLIIAFQSFMLASAGRGASSRRTAMWLAGIVLSGSSLALSTFQHSPERGAAIWVASCMVAGFLAPMLAPVTRKLAARLHPRTPAPARVLAS